MLNPFSHYLETGQLDFSTGHIKFFNVDMIMVPTSTMAHFYKSCGENAKDIFYKVGFEQVKAAFAAYEKQFKVSQMSFETFQSLFPESLQLGGWGKIFFKNIDFDNIKKNLIVVEKNPFAQHYFKMFGKQQTGIDDYLRGVFAAGFFLISAIKVKCVETKCIAKGDEFCEFRFS